MMGNSWALTAGILGNIISFIVFLAPVSTFYRIYKKKSTEGFQAVPYIVALFSAMLWLYYAFIKTNEMLIIIINSIGCVVEAIYIVIFLAYTHKKAMVYAVKLILFLDVGIFSIIVLSTILLLKGKARVTVVGWVCVGFAASVFAAPLSIMKQVITTKSVEFMPFYLSFFLTISAVVWFFYGLLIKDLYIMLPNVLGLLFGLAQMLLHAMYRVRREPIADGKDEGLTKNKEMPIGDEQRVSSHEWVVIVKESNENENPIHV